jgi:sec-independent protein translocase protein TatB
MFDVTSSKLLILGVVALLVIGPKDLPALLRTLGRYMGIIKRHAAEFRAQFDEAMRESELEQLKKEVETVGSTAEAHMRAAEHSLETELASASDSVTPALSGQDSAVADGAAAGTPEAANPPVGAADPQAPDAAAADRSLEPSLEPNLEPGPDRGREADVRQHVPEKSGA